MKTFLNLIFKASISLLAFVFTMILLNQYEFLCNYKTYTIYFLFYILIIGIIFVSETIRNFFKK